jgi:3-oxoacyl-[acyl-carrier protein] reductase
MNRNVVIYGAGGTIGSALARAFAADGATLFLVGRHQPALDKVAAEIADLGGGVHVAEVDALDAAEVEAHAGSIPRIDVSLNVIGLGELQGVPLIDLAPDEFTRPVTDRVRTQFLTATAAARRMVIRGSGVVLLLTASSAKLAGPMMGGFGVACAAIEGFTRNLAGELGPQGVRVVCLRSNYIPETHPDVEIGGDHYLVESTLLGRLPTLAQLCGAAVFAASEDAGAMTGAVLNLTCGAILD